MKQYYRNFNIIQMKTFSTYLNTSLPRELKYPASVRNPRKLQKIPKVITKRHCKNRYDAVCVQNVKFVRNVFDNAH